MPRSPVGLVVVSVKVEIELREALERYALRLGEGTSISEAARALLREGLSNEGLAARKDPRRAAHEEGIRRAKHEALTRMQKALEPMWK